MAIPDIAIRKSENPSASKAEKASGLNLGRDSMYLLIASCNSLVVSDLNLAIILYHRSL